MSYRLIDANALNGVISNDDYEKVLNAPCIFADLPNGVDGNHYVLEQEQKAGHWEWMQYDYNPKLGDWHCSECRSVVIECVNKEEKGGIPLYKYCPQCGIKMQKVG